MAPPMEPYIAAETASFLVVYKPPRMHTVPLRQDKENTLLAWIALRYPDVILVKGRKEIEGGIVHRLDYETHGLVLCARTDDAMELLLKKQANGEIVKEYEACCYRENNAVLPGFPPLPAGLSTRVDSAFRPYGKGRKAVRPLLAENAKYKAGEFYRTEILSCTDAGDKCFYKLRICKGFRHQIRCHLAWIGRPIINDVLYSSFGGSGTSGFLALRATGIVIGG